MGTPCWMVVTSPNAGDKVLFICREETGAMFTVDVPWAPNMCKGLSHLVPWDQGGSIQRRVLLDWLSFGEMGLDMDAGAHLELAGLHGVWQDCRWSEHGSACRIQGT